MVGDYISREAAIRALQPTHAPAINEVLASVLRRVPAADVVEVRHGRWEWDRLREAYRCSCCDNYNADRTAYCPNCGADLREGTT
jgi:hypothetical protein